MTCTVEQMRDHLIALVDEGHGDRLVAIEGAAETCWLVQSPDDFLQLGLFYAPPGAHMGELYPDPDDPDYSPELMDSVAPRDAEPAICLAPWA